MPRVLKSSQPSDLTASNVTISRQSIQLRAIPHQTPASTTAAELRNAIFSKRPPTQDLYRTRFGRALNLQNIDNALRDADWGNMRRITDLSRETIDTDPHLAAVLNKRFVAISSLPWEVIPAEGHGVDLQKARFYADVVRGQIKQLPNFSQRINQLAWGMFDGRAALENQWVQTALIPNLPVPVHPEFGSVNWMIKDIGWIHPRRLQFGPDREIRVCDDQSSGTFTECGLALRDFPLKFISWTPQLFGDYPEREGLARRALYWSFFKRFSARERMILLELFGKPWRWLEVGEDSTADRDDLKDADKMLENIGGNSSFRFPRGTQFKVEQPEKGAGQIHQETIEESDKQISKLVLGQTGTTDANPAGLNNVQANVMQDEQFIILKHDAMMVGEVFETFLTDPIIELNYGPQELTHAPHFKLRAEVATDRGKELDRLKKAVEAGLEITVGEAYEISGFRQPKSDEIVIRVETPPLHPMAVQPPPERPVLVYPSDAKLPSRKMQPISPSGEGGLPSPEVRPPAAAPGQPPAPAQPAAPKPLIDESEIVAATRGLDPHPADLKVVMTIMLGSRSGCPTCASEVLLEGDGEGLARQPEEAVIGSLETLIAKGVKEGARELQKISVEYLEAVEGQDTAQGINAMLDLTHDDVDLFGYSRSVERRVIHGAMAGALASQFEFEEMAALPVAEFEQLHGPKIVLAPTDPNFVDRALQSAITWFRSKNVVTRTVFDRLTAAAKRRAFTVAGMSNNLMLQRAKDALEHEIRTGGTLRNFRKVLAQRFETAGFVPANPSHVETVYRTNVLNAYNSGRHAQATQPSVLRLRPFWQIRTPNDGPPRQRKKHQDVHLWVLRADDTFWRKAYPPFGYNCRCRVATLSKLEVDARSLRVRTGGEVSGLPDPGFTSGVPSLL